MVKYEQVVHLHEELWIPKKRQLWWNWGRSCLRKTCVSAFDFLLWPSACHTWRTQWGRRARWRLECLPGGRSSSAGSSRWCYLQRREMKGDVREERECEDEESKSWHARTTKWVFHQKVLHPVKFHIWCTWQAAVFPLDIKGGFVCLCMRGNTARNKTATQPISWKTNPKTKGPLFIDTIVQH